MGIDIWVSEYADFKSDVHFDHETLQWLGGAKKVKQKIMMEYDENAIRVSIQKSHMIVMD